MNPYAALNPADLLDEQSKIQAAFTNANQLASMLPRSLKEQEAMTVEAALSGSDEARTRLEIAVDNVRRATEAKATAEALRLKLAESTKAIEIARGRERAMEAEALKQKFADKYTVYKAKCEEVKAGLRELINLAAQYSAMSGGQPMPNWGETRERLLNLPAIESPMNDIATFSTGRLL
jgi:hypothetical protein